MHVRIKASKTDSFPKEAEIHICLEVYPLCEVQAMMAYLVQWGNVTFGFSVTASLSRKLT